MAAGMIAHIMGALFTCGALALVAFGFATSHWQTIMVDRSHFQNEIEAVPNNNISQQLRGVAAADPAFTSRVRGLFETCYLLPNDNSITWENTTSFQDGDCVAEQGYELSRNPSTIGYGQAYELRIQLMRCHFAFLVTGMFMLVLGALSSALGCCCIQVKMLQLAGCMNFGGAFFTAASVTFFHAFTYLEMKQIDIQGFLYYYLSRPALYATLTNNWSVALGYSYILVWLGVGVGLIGGIMFFIAAAHIHTKHHEEDKHKLANERALTGAGNPAYALNDDVKVLPGIPEPEDEADWENEIVEEGDEEEEVEPIPVPVPYPVPVPVPSYSYPPPAPSLYGMGMSDMSQPPMMYDQGPPPIMYDQSLYAGGYNGPVMPAAIVPASAYPYGMYNSRL